MARGIATNAVALALCLSGWLSGCGGALQQTPSAQPVAVYVSGGPVVYVNANTANVYVGSAHARPKRKRAIASTPPSPSPANDEPPPSAVAPNLPTSSIPEDPVDDPNDAPSDDPSAEADGDEAIGVAFLGSSAACIIPGVLLRAIARSGSNPDESPAAAQAEVRAVNTQIIASYVWLGVGGALGVVGGYYLYESHEETQALQVSASPLPGGGALSLSGTF
jgi:hypothetical protein